MKNEFNRKQTLYKYAIINTMINENAYITLIKQTKKYTLNVYVILNRNIIIIIIAV